MILSEVEKVVTAIAQVLNNLTQRISNLETESGDLTFINGVSEAEAQTDFNNN